MKKSLVSLFAVLGLSVALSGCSLFGVDAEKAEKVRADAEKIVAVAEIANGFASVAVVKYNSLPDCAEGGPAICKNPTAAAALSAASDALAARLAEVRAALAAGLDDGTRLALLTDALLNAANDVNKIVAQIKGSQPSTAKAIGA
jgi:hypothetical protein